MARERKERAVIRGEDDVDKHTQENKRGEPSKKIETLPSGQEYTSTYCVLATWGKGIELCPVGCMCHLTVILSYIF